MPIENVQNPLSVTQTEIHYLQQAIQSRTCDECINELVNLDVAMHFFRRVHRKNYLQ